MRHDRSSNHVGLRAPKGQVEPTSTERDSHAAVSYRLMDDTRRRVETVGRKRGNTAELPSSTSPIERLANRFIDLASLLLKPVGKTIEATELTAGLKWPGYLLFKPIQVATQIFELIEDVVRQQSA